MSNRLGRNVVPVGGEALVGVATRAKIADQDRVIVELSICEAHGEDSLKGVGNQT